jgi:hypothetical protein
VFKKITAPNLTAPSAGDVPSNVVPLRGQKGPSYFKLYTATLDSTNWASLSANAQALYVNIAGRHNGFNNGAIQFSIRDGKQILHAGQATVYRALHELQDCRPSALVGENELIA